MDSRGTRPCSSGIDKRDRHSKVLTSKGLKDRRIRLSSETALKFYYVHHMLGFNQPTKSIEWLLHHAQPAIEDLFLQATHATFDDLKFKAHNDLVQPELAWFNDQCIWSPSSHTNIYNPSQEEEEQQSRNDEDEDQRQQELQKKDFFSIHTAQKSESEPRWKESIKSKGIAVERRAKARERARERSKHKNNNQTSLFSGQRRTTTSEFCESVGENLQNWHGLGFPEENLGNTHLLAQYHLIGMQDSSVYSDHTFSQNPFQSAHSNCMVSSMVFPGFSNTCYHLDPSPHEMENGFYNP